MSCTSPLSLFIWYDSKGEKCTHLSPSGVSEWNGHINPYRVPCGKCLNCLKSKSAEWSNRINCELQYHEKSMFITLTYDSDHVPISYDENGKMRYSLKKRDLQLFIKRLRKYYGDDKLRYFCVGEYGPRTFRPHYHGIIFGVFPDDCELFQFKADGNHLYTSEILARLWGNGFVTVGNATFGSANYCASYVTGKLGISHSKQWYEKLGVEAPKALMSRKPGIGSQWADDHVQQILSGNLLSCPSFDGISQFTTPRYFLEKFRLTNPDEYSNIKERNLELVNSHALDKFYSKEVDTFTSRARDDEFYSELRNKAKISRSAI